MNLILLEGLAALAQVQAVCPHAIIAGGFLRDLYFGKEPKDIDIFVPYMDNVLRDKFHAVHPGAKVVMGVSYVDQDEVEAVYDLPSLQTPSGLTVQVIMLAPGLTPLERVVFHDFDFCQAWTWGQGGIVGGVPVLDIVKDTGMVTLVHCEDQREFDRSMRRWDRLKLKYPELILNVGARFLPYLPSHDPAPVL